MQCCYYVLCRLKREQVKIVIMCYPLCNSEKRFQWTPILMYLPFPLLGSPLVSPPSKHMNTHIYSCTYSFIHCFPNPLHRAHRWAPSWESISLASRTFWGSSCFCDWPGLLAQPAYWSLWLLWDCAALVWVFIFFNLTLGNNEVEFTNA